MFLHYKNINSKYALYDRHMHTNWTDGKNTIEEMIEAAEKLGMKARNVRLTFIYFTFATLGAGFAVYLIMAFWLKIKDLIYTKRSSVFDL